MQFSCNKAIQTASVFQYSEWITEKREPSSPVGFCHIWCTSGCLNSCLRPQLRSPQVRKVQHLIVLVQSAASRFFAISSWVCGGEWESVQVHMQTRTCMLGGARKIHCNVTGPGPSTHGSYCRGHALKSSFIPYAVYIFITQNCHERWFGSLGLAGRQSLPKSVKFSAVSIFSVWPTK